VAKKFYIYVVELSSDSPLCDNKPVLFDTREECINTIVCDIRDDWKKTWSNSYIDMNFSTYEDNLRSIFKESDVFYDEETEAVYTILECTYPDKTEET
jgi:hypothetical protein